MGTILNIMRIGKEMGLMYELKLNQSIYQGIFILPFININQAFLHLWTNHIHKTLKLKSIIHIFVSSQFSFEAFLWDTM